MDVWSEFVRIAPVCVFRTTDGWEYQKVPNPPESNCPQCGTLFQPRDSRHKFCSPGCGVKRLRLSLPHINCLVCKKEFQPRQKRIKCCSAECSDKYWKSK